MTYRTPVTFLFVSLTYQDGRKHLQKTISVGPLEHIPQNGDVIRFSEIFFMVHDLDEFKERLFQVKGRSWDFGHVGHVPPGQSGADNDEDITIYLVPYDSTAADSSFPASDQAAGYFGVYLVG